MKIKICADSTCDLSPELVKEFGVAITPLYVIKEGIAFADGIEIKPEDIYNHVKAGGNICGTAAVSVSDYEEFFREQLERNDAVVHFHISSEMSSCYQNACIAAEEVGNVYPVDTRNLSTGIGLLILRAAEQATAGTMTAEEIWKDALIQREKLDVSFVLSTLDYLRKGGRCSALAALGANLLSLKPCIEVRQGKMGVGKKYRGQMVKSVIQYIRDRLENRTDIDTERIFLTDSSGFSEEELDSFEEEILRCQPFQKVLRTKAGCTISNHCGPQCIGILYFHS